MSNITRRKTLAFFTLAPFAGWLAGQASTGDPSNASPQPHQWAGTSPREVIRTRYFPNVVLTTQEGRNVRLYDDLIKDKTMLLNFMYTSCDRICPRVTQNLVRVQKLLGNRVGRDVFIYSFTLDPSTDTPKVLKKYAEIHQVRDGWSFLTGNPDDLDMLRRRLGFTDPDPIQDKDKENHIGNIRYGNEPRQLWGACPGMSHPEFIVEAISWVDGRKVPQASGKSAL